MAGRPVSLWMLNQLHQPGPTFMNVEPAWTHSTCSGTGLVLHAAAEAEAHSWLALLVSCTSGVWQDSDHACTSTGDVRCGLHRGMGTAPQPVQRRQLLGVPTVRHVSGAVVSLTAGARDDCHCTRMAVVLVTCVTGFRFAGSARAMSSVQAVWLSTTSG
jgi:hypothetical protein